MGISVIGGSAAGGVGGGTNDFVLSTNSNTTYVLDRTYASGRYELAFSDSDSTFDIYAIAENGTYAGYTNSTVLEASANFAEIVVLGAASGVRITFTHIGVITEASSAGDVATAGAFVNSVVTNSLPDIDDTTVVNGGNFATDVAVSFIGQDTTETAAKVVVRSSSTQLVVTRPDAFSPDNSPYTLKFVNPGIPAPTATNAHLLSNSVTAGTNPSWTTPADIFYNVGGATSITLLATDTEGSDIDYSLVSGTLPAGLSLDGETGAISGTFSGAASESDVTNITVRATDAGGNFLDKAFNLTANTAPTWTTAAGALAPDANDNTAYSFQLVASTGTAGGTLTYSLVGGSLLTGHTLSSTGVISGTSADPVDTVANFTIRVTDEGGLFVDRAFSLTVSQVTVMTGGTAVTTGGYTYHTFTASSSITIDSLAVGADVEVLLVAGGGGGGGENRGGGGGAGGVQVLTIPTSSLSVGSSAIQIGGGGAGRAHNGGAVPGGDGTDSSIFGYTSDGGGGGGAGSGSFNGRFGGSGGGGGSGGSCAGGAGIAGQGRNGGGSNGSSYGSPYNAGGGGGKTGEGGRAFSTGGGGGGAGITLTDWASATGTGSSNAYGGGGGGGGWDNSYGSFPGGSAPGGVGGGGNGGGKSGTSTAVQATAGTANTGGGGGGCYDNWSVPGKGGGSGIVIVRYAA